MGKNWYNDQNQLAETSKDMIRFSLKMQIKQRMELLEKLA